MARVPERGWRPGGRGTRCFGGTSVGDAGGVGPRGGCPQGLFSEARVAVGAGVAVYPHTRVRSRNASRSHLRSLPPLHFNFLCVPLR